MADTATLTPLKRRERIVASQDLPGVPAGTAGMVLTRVGLTWDRYFVRFDNGVERGSIDRSALARRGDHELANSLDARSASSWTPFAIVAVLLSVLVAPIGAVLGHMALGRVGRDEAPAVDRTPAIIAIVLGWTLTLVGFFAAVYAISV